WVLVFAFLFLGGIAGGFFYFSKNGGPAQTTPAQRQEEKLSEDSSFIRVYYPSEGRLIMEERRVKRQASLLPITEEIAKEFLKGPSGAAESNVPVGTKLLGVYAGNDGILYVDFSDEFRRNFQGDALSEFLLLKGLYDSIISNVTGVDDVKVLVEGKEIESIGGHLFALYPLKNTVSEAR
ncbi:MAG TPA: GerMN domain-containing protein, partial [Thermodesulfovibrionales bacterium]|nr:GerMN domain-containing protein [Thermodesulfovibrionales bacterium]